MFCQFYDNLTVKVTPLHIISLVKTRYSIYRVIIAYFQDLRIQFRNSHCLQSAWAEYFQRNAVIQHFKFYPILFLFLKTGCSRLLPVHWRRWCRISRTIYRRWEWLPAARGSFADTATNPASNCESLGVPGYTAINDRATTSRTVLKLALIWICIIF